MKSSVNDYVVGLLLDEDLHIVIKTSKNLMFIDYEVETHTPKTINLS